MCFASALLLARNASASGSAIQVTLDGRPISLDVPPQVIDGRTMVPMRAIFESLGALVTWDSSSQTVTAITSTGKIIRLTVGSRTIYIDNVANIIDAPAQIVDGRTMVSMRLVAQAMGLDVEWVPSTRSVTIETPESFPQLEQMVLDLLNIERGKHGLHPLVWDDGLATASRRHSRDFSDYTIMDSKYGDLPAEDRMSLAGVSMRFGGLNIVYTFRSPELIVDYLLKTSSANLLSKNNTHVGVGFHRLQDTRFKCYTAFYFGREQSTLRKQMDYPPLSSVTLPNRKLSAEEMAAWDADYNATGGPNHFELEVVRLVNKERANAGLRPLTIDMTLMKVSRFKAQSMSDLDYIDHSGIYGQPWDLAKSFGHNSGTYGENLARGHTTAEDVVRAFMNSPGHRANILRANFNVIGVGLYVCENFTFSWTQSFSGGNSD